jgi:hypothetical protein
VGEAPSMANETPIPDEEKADVDPQSGEKPDARG